MLKNEGVLFFVGFDSFIMFIGKWKVLIFEIFVKR